MTSRVEVRTSYLEMRDPGQLKPARTVLPDLELKQATLPSPELNRWLYMAVGSEWLWIDRLAWSRERWLAYLDRPQLQTWLAYLGGTPVGYFELELQEGDDVEVAYFGLLPGSIGKGMGGQLLTSAIERAWSMGAARVWLHTCTLDHPAALANYLARGMRVYKEEVAVKDLPLAPPTFWPRSAP
jgi:GNAT superfamily N-acetyltransferase